MGAGRGMESWSLRDLEKQGGSRGRSPLPSLQRILIKIPGIETAAVGTSSRRDGEAAQRS